MCARYAPPSPGRWRSAGAGEARRLPPLRAPLRLAGWLVVAAALGFLGHGLWQSAPWRLAAMRSAELAWAIGCGTLVYGLAGFLLADAWRHLLGPAARAGSRWSYYALYGRTQIAKYLPGNCFHFVGRQILGRRLGHGHAGLALASIAEAALLLAVAGALAFPLLGPELARILRPWPLWPVASLIALSGLVLIAWWAWHAPAVRRIIGTFGALAREMPRAGLLHLTFFPIAGLVLWMLAQAGSAPAMPGVDFLTAVSAVSLGWWAGFVVPGASAGVGVREAVLVLALEPHLGAEGALLVAMALRVVTTLGDLLFFALACLISSDTETEVPAQLPN